MPSCPPSQPSSRPSSQPSSAYVLSITFPRFEILIFVIVRFYRSSSRYFSLSKTSSAAAAAREADAAPTGAGAGAGDVVPPEAPINPTQPSTAETSMLTGTPMQTPMQSLPSMNPYPYSAQPSVNPYPYPYQVPPTDPILDPAFARPASMPPVSLAPAPPMTSSAMRPPTPVYF